ncbi:MAG TPA: hypothetical protein DIC19_02490 [Erysipelotrichaceae bacterium]|nr:hypothetical protein [Erysipelotrichaceae bacterium]
MEKAKRSIAMFKALINLDYNNDILEPFQNLVESIIFNDSRTSFNLSQIQERLLEVWDIEIPDMPLKIILGRLVAKGSLRKNNNRASYTIIDRKTLEVVALNVEKQKTEIMSNFDFLVNDFISFCFQSKNIEITYSEAINQLEVFLDENATYISLRSMQKSSESSVLFSIYFIEKCIIDENLSDLLKSILFGYILSESIFLELPNNNQSFDKLNIVIDTPILFKLLGINELDESSIYKLMIDDLLKMGAKITTFNHSIDEMEQIISGSIYWVENGMFDPTLASETSLYYVNRGSTKADIEEDRLTLRDRIQSLGIEVICERYDEAVQRYFEDETKIHESITKVYANGNMYFNEEASRQTLALDAKSINQIYVLRSGAKSMSLSDSRAVLLTSNSSLVYASKIYNDSLNVHSHGLVAPCIKDVHLGTYIWLNKPMNLKDLALRKSIQRAYSIMTPSHQLWQKFCEELKKCVELSEITDKQAYFLRTSTFARQTLVKITLKDLGNVTFSTPIQVLEEIKNEGKKESEEKLLLEKQKNVQLKEIFEKERAESQNQIHKLYDQELKKKMKYLNLVSNSIVTISFSIASFLFFPRSFNLEQVRQFIFVIIPLSFAIATFYFIDKKNKLNILGFIYSAIESRIKSDLDIKYEIAK